MYLILYTKPGCHLCEGLEEKLARLQHTAPELALELETRDITRRPEWWTAYEYEVPVLLWQISGGELVVLPRLAPRAGVDRLATLLRQAITAQSSA